VSALLALAPPLLFRAILDHSIPQGNKGQITILAAFLVIAALGDAVLAILQRWYSSRIGEGLIYDLRVALFDKVQQMPIAFFTRTQTGSLISRLNNDVVGAQTAVTSTLGSVVSNVVVLVTTLTAMLILEWRLTLLSLVVLPVFIIPAKRVGAKLQTIARIFFVALGLVGAVGAAAIYGVGAHLVVDGGITAGTLVAMAAFVQRIYQPLTGLTNARIEVMTAFVSFERVFEVLDAPVSIQDAPGAIDLVDARGELELRNVTFRYPAGHSVSIGSLEAAGVMQGVDPDTDVLQNINLHVQPGETIALVGVSGAGKSTLASLIPRLYDATAGSILIDGQDVKNLTQRSVQNAIGVVSQDPHLFHESIGANLRYAKPDATDDELRAACEGAQIFDTIAALPEGLNTLVGERGYRMSGGEKQRLAIARLLLKDPAIMILDEATSHLDNENEAAVQVALEAALRGRTALVIAHRLSTVRRADRIVVLDAGHLVEEGTHEELMERKGLYAAQVHAGELGQ
jgi:ATP-binding cassette subfamily B protein